MIQSRYRRILWFFAGVLLHLLWWDILLPRIGFGKISRRSRSRRLVQLASNYRSLAVQMGGVMIKVGQFLSARLDVLPHEIINELSGLQDEVQPEAFDDIRRVLEAEIKGPISTWFIDFNPNPLASASIGQVHQAFLKPVLENDPPIPVVVKIQRPQIEKLVETDLAALRVVSAWVQLYKPISKRVHVPSLLEEFSRSLREETDYLNEGKNGETFATNFAGQSEVRVPRIYWNYTTRCVLTMEEIQAIKITDERAIDAAGIDRAEVANRLLDTYLKQIFEDRFFHADPHPGNLFVLPSPESSGGWQLIFVDFGMTGSVPPTLLAGLREMLIAVGTRDVPRMIRAYQELGILLPGADTELLEKAGERIFDRFWGKSTTEIVNLGQQEAAAFAREFGSLLYELPFQIPENIILLGRCLGILSGICTGLNADFNIWERIMPYARRIIESEEGEGNIWLKELGALVQSLVTLPRRTESVLQRLEQGRLEVQFPAMKDQISRLEHSVQRLTGGIVFCVFLLIATQLYLAGHTSLALTALAAAALTLVGMLFKS